jgi:hypothetical protein
MSIGLILAIDIESAMDIKTFSSRVSAGIEQNDSHGNRLGYEPNNIIYDSVCPRIVDLPWFMSILTEKHYDKVIQSIKHRKIWSTLFLDRPGFAKWGLVQYVCHFN